MGAGGRTEREKVNLTILYLPTYIPELNRMEPIILFLKSNRFANRVFKDVAALT